MIELYSNPARVVFALITLILTNNNSCHSSCFSSCFSLSARAISWWTSECFFLSLSFNFLFILHFLTHQLEIFLPWHKIFRQMRNSWLICPFIYAAAWLSLCMYFVLGIVWIMGIFYTCNTALNLDIHTHGSVHTVIHYQLVFSDY